MKHKKNDLVGGDNVDQSWIGGATIGVIVFALLMAAGLCWLTGCSPKIIERTVKEIEYRDRAVHDTTTFEIEKEVEKIVTLDTVSHLENKYAKSDAVVSKGFLTHSLESKPQIIKIPVEVHVTDTLIKESEIRTEIKEVEKPLSWWQKFRIEAFWWLLLGVVALLVWTFRKLIF